MGMADQVTCCALSLRQTFCGHEAALLRWAMLPLDDRPCTWCGQDYDLPAMILCDHATIATIRTVLPSLVAQDCTMGHGFARPARVQ